MESIIETEKNLDWKHDLGKICWFFFSTQLMYFQKKFNLTRVPLGISCSEFFVSAFLGDKDILYSHEIFAAPVVSVVTPLKNVINLQPLVLCIYITFTFVFKRFFYICVTLRKMQTVFIKMMMENRAQAERIINKRNFFYISGYKYCFIKYWIIKWLPQWKVET